MLTCAILMMPSQSKAGHRREVGEGGLSWCNHDSGAVDVPSFRGDQGHCLARNGERLSVHYKAESDQDHTKSGA